MMMTSWAAPSTKIWDQYYKTVFTVRNTTALKLRQYFDALFEVLSKFWKFSSELILNYLLLGQFQMQTHFVSQIMHQNLDSYVTEKLDL